MSRTFRRKSSRPEYLYNENSSNYDINHPYNRYLWCQKSLIEFGGKEHIRRNRLYHSDCMYAGCPSDFKKGLNREFRSKNKAFLRNAIKTDNHDNNSYVKYRKIAMWLYW